MNGSGNMCVLIEISTDCRGLISPYADLEVTSLITAQSHAFIKIDHELFFYDQSASLFQGGMLLVSSERYGENVN